MVGNAFKWTGLFFLLSLSHSSGFAQIALNSDGFFEGPGCRFLVNHNTYVDGRQGGLQMLLHGTRVLDSGTLFCRTAAGKKYGYYGNNEKRLGARTIDLESQMASFRGEFLALEMKYQLAVTTDGESITIRVQLDQPPDWDKVSELTLKVEIFPEAYFNKTYLGGSVSDFFHERHMGHRMLIPKADKILVGPEDSRRSLAFSTQNALLSLRDERRDLRVSGYMLFASLPPGSQQKTFSLTITPKLDTTWRRKPVIQFSQIGYHPDQRKRAVLELDKRVTKAQEIELLHLDDAGSIRLVKKEVPVKWGPLFDYHYYTFDFTDIVDQAFGETIGLYSNKLLGFIFS